MVLCHRFLLLIMLVSAAVGCGEEPQIAEYKAPKIREAVAAAQPAAAAPQRMLGVVFPGPAEQAWFLKITGEDAAIETIAEPFGKFVQSLKFNEQGEPEWQLPEGWTERAGDAIRFRTIQISGDRPLEMSVTKLPLVGELNEYLLANFNRWRGQLNLPPMQLDEFPTLVGKLTSDHGVELYAVDFRSAGASEDRSATQSSAANPARPQSPAAPASDVVTQPPPEWQPGQLNSLRSAAYEVVQGPQRAEITVSKLSTAAGDVPANVNRWRGQIGLPPASPAEIKADARELDVLGTKAVYVNLVGAESQTPRQSILGVIAPVGELIWFVKMTGDAELVEQERERFEKFAESLELR